MDCLDIVWMVVSPCPSHAFGVDMIGHHVVVGRELFVTDGAYSFLLGDFSVEQLSHLCPRPQLPVTPWVVWILDTLHSQSDQLRFRDEFPATAGNRLVDRTDFVGTEPHGSSPKKGLVAWFSVVLGETGWESDLPTSTETGVPGVEDAVSLLGLRTGMMDLRQRGF
jgi:hypothetical protein